MIQYYSDYITEVLENEIELLEELYEKEKDPEKKKSLGVRLAKKTYNLGRQLFYKKRKYRKKGKLYKKQKKREVRDRRDSYKKTSKERHKDKMKRRQETSKELRSSGRDEAIRRGDDLKNVSKELKRDAKRNRDKYEVN